LIIESTIVSAGQMSEQLFTLGRLRNLLHLANKCLNYTRRWDQ
jgi:hypothetical protein